MISSADRSGEEELGLSTCMRTNGVLGTSVGASIFCEGAVAGATAIATVIEYCCDQAHWKSRTWRWRRTPSEEKLIVMTKREQ